jgi:excisionase family DNA binding protein
MAPGFERTPTGELITMAEAARLAGVHRNTVRSWCANGRLSSVRINRRGDRRVRRPDVERVAARRLAASFEPGPAGPGDGPADHSRRQQSELELRLAGQRRLLDVNSKLLSNLDPVAVLDSIADLLKDVVAYDALTIYRVDRATGRRWAVIARDRFAEVILREQMPIGVGITGWAIDHRQAVLCNDALEDPRCVQIPGTPVEPE